MAQTKINFAIKQGNSETDGDLTGSSGEKTEGSNSSGNPDTGFFTVEESTNVTTNNLGSFISQPVVSGVFIFVGFLLLLGFVAKICKNKRDQAFKASSGKKVFIAQVLGFASLLMLFTGIGGMVARRIGTEAINGDPNAITTNNNINGVVVEAGSDYKLYCATDVVTIKNSTESGYLLYAEANNNGNLVSSSASIESIQDWSKLANGTWGFRTNNETYPEITEEGKYKPIHIGSGVIAYSYQPTAAGEQIKVDYCTKVALNAVEANYSSTVEYGLIALDSNTIPFVDGIDYDSVDDYDGDGLSNRKESQYGTNVNVNDSDLDGLSDSAEINTYNTNPLNNDTDQDGMGDFDEITLGLNPRKTDSKGDGILDNERTLSYTIKDDIHNVWFDVTGTGNIASSYIEVNDNIVDAEDNLFNLYSLKTTGNISSAQISINYDLDDIKEAIGDDNIDEDELVIAAYDAVNDRLETIDTINQNNTLIAQTDNINFQYAIADKNTDSDNTIIEDIVGSIDNVEEESLRDSLGGLLKKIVQKVTTKIQSNATAKATDCLKDKNTGCDSGFKAANNGFSFSNFSTSSHGGVCAGMASFSMLYKAGKIKNGTYSYKEPSSGTEYTYTLNLNSGNDLYTNSQSIDKNFDYGSLLNNGLSILTDTRAHIKDSVALLAALDDARGAYGNLSSTKINNLYGSLGLQSLIGGASFHHVSPEEYLEKLKTNFNAGNTVVANFHAFAFGFILAGGHAINLESIKFIDTKTTILSTIDRYELKYYDNNYPGRDMTAYLNCSTTTGCFITNGNIADLLTGSQLFFLLGTRASIAGPDDVVNIFDGGSRHIDYTWE